MPTAAAAFSSPHRVAWLAVGMLTVAACEAPAETSVSRLARERELGRVAGRAEEHRRELARLEQEGAATAAAVAAAKGVSIRRAAELRAVVAELKHQIGQLQTAEADLVAARVRATEIETQLQPLRALEGALRDQVQQQADLAQRLASLQAEVAAATTGAAAAEAELRPRLEALQRQLAAARQAESALAAANAAIAEALRVLAPAPVPAATEPKK